MKYEKDLSLTVIYTVIIENASEEVIISSIKKLLYWNSFEMIWEKIVVRSAGLEPTPQASETCTLSCWAMSACEPHDRQKNHIDKYKHEHQVISCLLKEQLFKLCSYS